MILNDWLNAADTREIAPGWSHSAFRAATLALAEALQGKAAVALWFTDAARLASALFAAWQAGCRVYLPPNAGEDNRAWLRGENALWITDDAAFPDAHLLYDDAREQAHACGHFAIDAQASIFLKTSGSSGEAKIIAKTAAHMTAEAQALAQILPWRDLPAHASVSAQHLYGLSFRIFAALACRWQISRAQLVYPEHLLHASAAPCLWITSPALLTRLQEKSGWETLTVRGVLSAGGMLPAATASAMEEKLGCTVLDIYGSTETGVIARRAGDAPWQLLPGVRVGENAQGALWAESPWIAAREQTADVADICGNTLILQGRADRILKFEDKRVSLPQLEQALMAHAWVSDAHCLRHPEHGRIAAWLALNDAGIAAFRDQGRAAVQQQLRRHLLASQERIALPRYWRFAAQLPRDTQAKIRHDDVRAAFLSPCTTPEWQRLPDEDDYRVYTAIIPLDLIYFAGHFAHFPLVPGVVEVQWAMDLAADLPCAALPATHLEVLKYQQFVRPYDRVYLRLRWEAGKHKLHFALSRQDDGGESRCASGRMVFAA